MTKKSWKNQILPVLPLRLRELINDLDSRDLDSLEEIRLRAGKPLIVQTREGEIFPGKPGDRSAGGACRVTAADLQAVLLLIAEFSLYARDEELKRGYLSLPGGHRAGFTGRVVMHDNEVKLMRDITAINIRVAREIKGAGESLLPHIYCVKTERLRHTLIVSPPQAGKTTMLRDLCRLISNGDPLANRPGFKAAIVDERSEIAGCYLGEPQLDVGIRTDVLDGCPKAQGLMMLIRSMSPQIVVTDELGRPEDARAVEEVVNTGAAVLATAHGENAADLLKRPSLAYLLEKQIFERIVLLSRKNGPGTVEGIFPGGKFQAWHQARGG